MTPPPLPLPLPSYPLQVPAMPYTDTCDNISFHNGWINARCRKADGTWAWSELSLDYHLANVDGNVRPARAKPGNFMSTCR